MTRAVATVAAALFVLGASGRAADLLAGGDPAREMWMSGFVKLKAGDAAEKAGNTIAAVRLYREAQQVFEDVQRQFAGWQTGLVTYRITYCAERVRALNAALPADNKDMTREQLAALVAAQKAQIKELEEQAFSAQEKVEALTATMSTTTAAPAAGGADEVAALREQVRRLEEEKKAWAARGAAEEERDALRARITALEEEKRTLAAQAAGLKDVQELKQLAAALEGKLADQARARNELQGQLTALVAERETLGTRLTAITTQLDELRALAERLQRENDALRK